MRIIYLTLWICLITMLLAGNAPAEISATIDRNRIAQDETLQLTISREGGISFSAADLTPLEKDFRILSRSQSSNTRIINGSVSSSTDLDLILAPKRSGILEIPPLSIGKEQSSPLQVKVLTQAQPKSRAENAPLFIETELDRESVLVQAQLLFTLRIYWAVEASIAQPADPQLKGALLERLDDATYNKSIAGRNYKVFERKYAIFPQKSGELEIPRITVRATVPDRQRRRGGLSDFFGARGREVRLRSESKTVTVQGKAPEYPPAEVWLPTDRLSIAEEWSEKTEKLQVGESVTVTIALAGHGLLAAQLPPIELPETDGIKLYQGKAEVQNLAKSEGVTGIRKESIALIPIESGQLELSEIRIPWWNRQEGRVEYAVVPARQLTIGPASPKRGQSGGPPALSSTEAVKADLPAGETLSLPWWSGINRPLLILSLFFGLAWLTTLVLLVKTRRLAIKPSAGGKGEAGGDDNLKEKEAFRKLRLACRSNDPGRARKALINWAKSTRPGHRVRTGADLEKILPDSGVAGLLEELDRMLYAREGRPQDWRGKFLFEKLETARKSLVEDRSRQTVLTTLYK